MTASPLIRINDLQSFRFFPPSNFFFELQFNFYDTLKLGTSLVFHKSTVPIVPTVSRTRKDTLVIFQIQKSSRGLKNLLKFKDTLAILP